MSKRRRVGDDGREVAAGAGGAGAGRKVEEADSSSSDEEEVMTTTVRAPKTPFAFNGRDTIKRVIVILEKAGLETVKTKKVRAR